MHKAIYANNGPLRVLSQSGPFLIGRPQYSNTYSGHAFHVPLGKEVKADPFGLANQ